VAPRDLSIRPLGLGEILDRAVALHRRHFRSLFAAALLVEAPLFVLARVELGRAQAFLLSAASGAASAGRLREAVEMLPPMALAGGLLFFGQLWVSAAAAVLVTPSLDPAAAPASPWRAILRRTPGVLGASAAVVCALLAAPALGAVPGALLLWRAGSGGGQLVGGAAAVLGAGLAFLAAFLATLLALPAAGVEGLGPRALLRSRWLMRAVPGAPLRERPGLVASVLLLAVFAITLAVNGLAGLPRAVAAAALAPGALGGRLPAAAEVPVVAFEVLALAALRPFGLVAVAVLYFDRRARREGLDLDRWARTLGTPA
jgi:hypothetical protein